MKDFTHEEIRFDDHVFVLDGVGDPGNVGTIIRTLDWFGFDQIILSAQCAEFYHPKVINSTMGSFTRVKAVTLDLNTFFEQNTLAVLCSRYARELIYLKPSLRDPCVIVMGNESHGIGEVTKKYIHSYSNDPAIWKG